MPDKIDVDRYRYYWALGKASNALVEVIELDSHEVENFIYDHALANRTSFNLAVKHPQESFERREPSEDFWTALYLASPLARHKPNETRNNRIKALFHKIGEHERIMVKSVIDLHNNVREDLWMEPRLNRLYRYALDKTHTQQTTIEQFAITAGDQDNV